MGCGISANSAFLSKPDKGILSFSFSTHVKYCFPMFFFPCRNLGKLHCFLSLILYLDQDLSDPSHPAFKAAVLIQRWYRRFVARIEIRRRCTWRIFQSIEYSGEQDHLKLNSFFDYLMGQFTKSGHKDRDFLNRILWEPENLSESKLVYQSVTVPDNYMGPRLSFPLFPDDAIVLLEAFKHKQQLHAHYVLRLFHEAQKHLSQLPNITHISTCYSEEITVCGDIHGQLADLFLIFHKNGLPAPQKTYVFNGDFVDRGKCSMEVLIILFVFLLIYPKAVHLNRGNHEDYMVNLRYGLSKEIGQKYKEHGNKILKLLQNVFSCLPLATVVDQKVFIVHGGVSDTTDLDQLATINRRRIISVLAQKRNGSKSLDSNELESGKFSRDSSHRAFDAANKSEVSKKVQEDLEACRRRAEDMNMTSSDSVIIEDEDIHQILDILWSDPIPQDGCTANEDRGGGCYFGPDVTKKFLQKHNLQFIIRSHECKPEGYDFCHNRKVITVFSASNYYTMGSNRGAYLKMGPDLIPHFIQYQASKTAHQLTMTQRLSRVEVSAYHVLKEKLFAHRSDLTTAFKRYDKKNTGLITLNDWANAVESVLQLGLPWRMLRPQLVLHLTNGKLEYRTWLRDIVTEQRSAVQERLQSSLLENIYRNLSNLETIFNIIDTDHSGLISLDEFRQTWKLFSSHMNIDISDENIDDLARSIDFNKDGNIDFNEFIEAFRLVSQSPS
ncbi:serine/threonine-protein phosphatase with EF-hands 2 isoform X2 [Sceloporus undulatus]|uniref:serine/threonine-protein phosphatase with EF-hands 2 isoform X2 n=1 Tax=Sceloporus undulatus TaxID=8520 RepID=UPI001C4DD5C9|nr:serine/threonine-protein phosphatase with EF-hands 2 isoform X2 [Sceloporus undulatus]